MRLLVLTPEFEASGGGIATFYRALAPALQNLGATVRVIEGSAFHAGERAPRVIDGVAVETLEVIRLQAWWRRFSHFAATPGLRRHLAAAWAMWEQADQGRDADVVEASDWGLLFVPPAVEASRPLIVQGHASVGQIGVHDPVAGEEVQIALVRLIEASVLRQSGLLQTYSDANADFWGVETERRPAVIRPAWAPRQPSADSPPHDRGLVIGRMQRWKGPQLLCAALDRLGPGAPDVDWIGRDTPWGAKQQSTSRHLAATFPDIWGRKVLPHPPIEPSEVAKRQAQALFNVVPSTWDVFNFTAVEAMASGRPTLVSTGAGASELVVDGENGYLFDSVDALCDGIERVVAATPAQRRAMGAAAQDTVRTALDPAAIAQTRIEAFQRAAAMFAAAAPEPACGAIGDLCRPGEPARGEDTTFLDSFPIRTLGAHLLDRVGGRLRPAGGRRSGT